MIYSLTKFSLVWFLCSESKLIDASSIIFRFLFISSHSQEATMIKTCVIIYYVWSILLSFSYLLVYLPWIFEGKFGEVFLLLYFLLSVCSTLMLKTTSQDQLIENLNMLSSQKAETFYSQYFTSGEVKFELDKLAHCLCWYDTLSPLQAFVEKAILIKIVGRLCQYLSCINTGERYLSAFWGWLLQKIWPNKISGAK